MRNILDFPSAFDPPALVVTLERNYRSTGAVLAAANAAIALAPERFAKTLWTEGRTAPFPLLVTVADDADQARYRRDPRAREPRGGRSLKAQAVLFRASHHSAALELELTRRNVPFVKYGGLKFLDAAHVKDAVALLRFAENPRDRVAGFRVALLLPGVGPKIAETIVGAAAADDGFATMAALRRRENARRFRRLRRPHAPACVARAPWPAEIADAVAWLSPLLETRYDDARVRMGDLEALERIAAVFPSRERFLSELALDPPDATSDEAGPPLRDEDYLILSTIHSAKGQEWRSVFVLNCVDGCIPSDLATGSSEEIEEERRLLYVAMTRAKDELTLIVPQRFYVHGQPRYGDRSVFASRTRFIPPALLKYFDRQTWPEAEREPSRPPRRAQASISRRACARCGGDANDQRILRHLIQMFWSDHGRRTSMRSTRSRGGRRHSDPKPRRLSRRAMALVLDWAQEHRAELIGGLGPMQGN